jgi:hypothetical protein
MAFSAAVVAPPVASAENKQTYYIWNLTSGPVKLDSYANPQGQGLPANVPAVGTVIPIGGDLEITVKDQQQAVPVLTGQGGAQKWTVTEMYRVAPGPIICQSSTESTSACSLPVGSVGDKNVVGLWDAPSTKISVPAADAQKQAEVLNSLCGNQNADTLGVKCNYSQMKRSDLDTKWRLPKGFSVVTNQSETETSSKEYSVSDTVTMSTTYTLTTAASAKFMKIVNVGITAEYKKEATETHTFTQTTILRIPPKRSGYICTSSPMFHYVGTLTTVAGNTTWTMSDVAVDLPNADAGAHLETWDTATYLPGDPCEGFVRGTVNGHRIS